MESKRQVTSRELERQPNTDKVNGEPETPEALQNDVVLENIFKFLGYKDLKSCRLVGNIAWLKNSKKAWWARSKVTLPKLDEGHSMTSYLNQTEIHSNATTYQLVCYRFEHTDFWDRVGNFIKDLNMAFCGFKSVDDFRHVIYTQCPNLQKLTIRHITIKTGTKYVEPMEWREPRFGKHNNLKSYRFGFSEMPVSWMEFLSHFPNLQDLEVQVENAEIFKAISIIRKQDTKMLQLKHLNISSSSESDYEEAIRSVFLDSNLSLETIHIKCAHCQPETLVEILDLHAKSLSKLILHSFSSSPLVLSTPPQDLQVLEELVINCRIIPADIFKHTPCVRKVDLHVFDPCYDRYILERIAPNLRVNTCKNLKLHVEEELRGKPDSDFESFLKAFPNVEILETKDLNNRKFSLICEHLSKLQSLEITESAVDVTGLLGFDPDSAVDAVDRNHNITNLKDLQSFSLQDKGTRNPTKDIKSFLLQPTLLTNLKNGNEIFNELKQLPRLKKFVLRNYKLQGEDQIWKRIFTEYSGS